VLAGSSRHPVSTLFFVEESLHRLYDLLESWKDNPGPYVLTYDVFCASVAAQGIELVNHDRAQYTRLDFDRLRTRYLSRLIA
jgi:hypothetical protein